MIPLPRGLGEDLSRLITVKVHESTYVILRRALNKEYLTKATGQRILDLLAQHDLKCTHPQFDAWAALVSCDNVHFESVEDYTVTNQTEDGYDLTVPGYETFMALDGVILSNTLQIHVPVSEKATNEVKGTTMSNLLFGDRTKSDLIVMPQHEAVLGIYAASAAKGGKTIKFKTEKEALEAYRQGDIQLRTQ